MQLIDASHCYEPRRKSIGTKRNDITDYCRELIVKAYGEFTEGVFGDKNGIYCESKIFDTVEFGYNKIVVERPLRYNFSCSEDRVYKIPVLFSTKKNKMWSWSDKTLDEKPMPESLIEMRDELLQLGDKIYLDEKEFISKINPIAKKYNLSKAQIKTLLYNVLGEEDPNGSICYDNKGNPYPNAELRDTENVPMVEDIDEYFAREVLPYAPDAWIDKTKTKVGYVIPMTRYFYEYQKPEASDDILSRIIGLEEEIKEALKGILA